MEIDPEDLLRFMPEDAPPEVRQMVEHIVEQHRRQHMEHHDFKNRINELLTERMSMEDLRLIHGVFDAITSGPDAERVAMAASYWEGILSGIGLTRERLSNSNPFESMMRNRLGEIDD